MATKSCSRCGVTTDDEAELPPGWSFEHGRRGIEWMCMACTRANVRSIEAKLPEEWWE